MPRFFTLQPELLAVLSGRVVDQSGLALPGVNVTVASPALQGTRSAATSSNGDYIIPFLPAGEYTVTFEASGFRKLEKKVRVQVAETIPMDAWKLELALEAVHSRWADPVPGTALDTVGFGTASDLPQVVGRVKGYGKSGDFDWTIYVAASYESVNFKGFGDILPNGVTLADGTVKTSVSPYVAEVGGLLKYSLVSLAFNVYTGSGTSQMAGALLQNGMIGDTAFWVQLGIQATPEFSIWGLFGNESLNKTDMANWAAVYANAAPKSDNQLIGGQLRYQQAGYAFALEGYRYSTKYLAVTTASPNTSYNAQTTNAGKGEPYRRLEAKFKAEKDDVAGVELERIAKDMSEFVRVLEPGNPDADVNGYVTMPNVSLPIEMMNLTIATRAYQANAAVLKRYQQMVDTTLELLR